MASMPQNMSHDQREILQLTDVAAKAAEEELVTLTAEEQVGCLTWWDWEVYAGCGIGES